MGCRYLEKVLPSPYGPRLPWWFPCSRSYWATGDVEGGLHAMAPVRRMCSRLKKLLRLRGGQEDTVAYQQVRRHSNDQFSRRCGCPQHCGIIG